MEKIVSITTVLADGTVITTSGPFNEVDVSDIHDLSATTAEGLGVPVEVPTETPAVE